MAITAVSLVDGDRQMVLYPREDLVLMGLAPGSPQVRVVSEPRPDGDGVIDTTSHYGGRQLAVDLLAIDTPAAILDELTAFTGPGARPYLVVSDDEWAQTRRLRLRVDQWSAPLQAVQSPTIRAMQAQWFCPDGTWEDADEATLTVNADSPSTTGRTYPRTYPRTYGPTSSSGNLETVNVGTAPANFRALLYGPCTAPRLINMTTGEELAFAESLTLASGEYVEVSVYGKTAYFASGTSQPRLAFLDFDASTWWQLQPGIQQIRYTGIDPGTASKALIYYRPVWL